MTASSRFIGQPAVFGPTHPDGQRQSRALIFISETIRREAAHTALVAAEQLPVLARDPIADLRAHLTHLDTRIDHYERQLVALARQCEPARRIQTLTGIGPLTASAITASIASGHEFANGRQFAAWLGLVPRQYSTGGETKLGRITKRGDAYLRTLLMLGARFDALIGGRLGICSLSVPQKAHNALAMGKSLETALSGAVEAPTS